ncbi:MAG TPA: nucleotidyltransferase family protein [Pararhizobium sp.]|nr:nucleotidyltransferase family protein [Pararhizobium sp.]
MRPSEALARHRDAILEILGRYPVANPRVFGSVARGEDSEESDLDILVERKSNLNYFDLARLEAELKDTIGVQVDIRTEGEFSPRVYGRISRDFRTL